MLSREEYLNRWKNRLATGDFDKRNDNIDQLLHKVNPIDEVIKEIREAKTEKEARQILLDNIVSLNSTEEISLIMHHSLIEGPNDVDLDKLDEDFNDLARTCKEIADKKLFSPDEFAGLTHEEVEERLSKTIWIHNGIVEEVYQDRNGRRYTLGDNGEKLYFVKDLANEVAGFDVERFAEPRKNFEKAMEIETSEPDISILEGTMFHEVNDLEDKSNVRTRKDGNK